MKDDNKIIDKIKKLLRQAESEKALGNIEMAGLFFAKAAMLQAEHNIQECKLRDDPDFDLGIEYSEQVHYDEVKSDGEWQLRLINPIQTVTQTRGVIGKRSRTIRYAGTPNATRVAVYMHEQAARIIKELSLKAFSDEISKIQDRVKFKATHLTKEQLAGVLSQMDVFLNNTEKELLEALIEKTYDGVKYWTISAIGCENLKFISRRKVWIRSYLAGAAISFGDALEEKYEVSLQEQYKQNEFTNSEFNAMVPVVEGLIEKFIDEDPKVKGFTSAKEFLPDLNAYTRGKKEGKTVNVTPSIESSNE